MHLLSACGVCVCVRERERETERQLIRVTLERTIQVKQGLMQDHAFLTLTLTLTLIQVAKHGLMQGHTC